MTGSDISPEFLHIRSGQQATFKLRIEPQLIVTDRIGLDDVPAAFQALAKPDSQCKVVVYPG